MKLKGRLFLLRKMEKVILFLSIDRLSHLWNNVALFLGTFLFLYLHRGDSSLNTIFHIGNSRMKLFTLFYKFSHRKTSLSIHMQGCGTGKPNFTYRSRYVHLYCLIPALHNASMATILVLHLLKPSTFLLSTWSPEKQKEEAYLQQSKRRLIRNWLQH